LLLVFVIGWFRRALQEASARCEESEIPRAIGSMTALNP
jgi:hypothetical protein